MADATIEAQPHSLPGSTGHVATSNAGEYLGCTVREVGGAIATVVLHDGADATGPIIEEISLQPGESVRDHYPRPGRLVTVGIYAVINGAVEGSVFQ